MPIIPLRWHVCHKQSAEVFFAYHTTVMVCHKQSAEAFLAYHTTSIITIDKIIDHLNTNVKQTVDDMLLKLSTPSKLF